MVGPPSKHIHGSAPDSSAVFTFCRLDADIINVCGIPWVINSKLSATSSHSDHIFGLYQNSTPVPQFSTIRQHSQINTLGSTLSDQHSHISTLRSAFSDQHSQIGTLRSVLSYQQSQISTLKSALSNQHYPMSTLRSGQHSQICIPRSAHSDQHSQTRTECYIFALSDLIIRLFPLSAFSDPDSRIECCIVHSQIFIFSKQSDH